MTAAAQKQLMQEALALPKKVRAKLANKLFESLDECEAVTQKEWDQAWKKELEKRIEEIESGKVKCIPYAEVRKRLNRILKKA